MRSQKLLLILVGLILLLRGAGVFAMVNCQAQGHMMANQQNNQSSLHNGHNNGHKNPQQASADMAMTHHNADMQHAEILKARDAAVATDDAGDNMLGASNDNCQACADCCTLHGAAVPLSIEFRPEAIHEKIIHLSYFHDSVTSSTQDRPPKA